MVRITGLSAPLVRRYLELFEGLDTTAHRPVLARLRRRFGPLEDCEDEEVARG